MSAYDIAERTLFDKYCIESSSKNKLNGPLIVGKNQIKGKCATLSSMNGKHENVIIPRYAHKYKFLFVVFSKTKVQRSDDDDVYVYKMEEVMKITRRSLGRIFLKDMPLSLDMDQFAKMAK